MKNTVKILTAVILAAILCFGSVTAIAAETAEDLKWNDYSYESGMYYYRTYEYIGTLAEGENTIDPAECDSYRSYAVFNAEKSGYYKIETWPDTSVPETYVDGVAHGESENFYGEYFYLSEGENIIGFYGIYYYDEPCEVNIKYLGDAITDIVYDENDFKDLVVSYDVHFNENYIIDGGPYVYIYGVDFEVIFSENTETFEDCTIYADVDPESGEYSLRFIDYTEPVQITTCKATDIVKSMEITNLDECLSAYSYYTGDTEPEAVPEAVKVTFTDGSTKTYENTDGDTYFGFDVEAPNGREYYSTVSIDYGSDDRIYIVIDFAWEEYARYEISQETADVCDNLEEFGEDNNGLVDKANYDAEWRLDKIFNSDRSFDDKVVLLLGIPGLYTNALFQIFCNFVELLEYYF